MKNKQRKTDDIKKMKAAPYRLFFYCPKCEAVHRWLGGGPDDSRHCEAAKKETKGGDHAEK